MLAEFEGVYQNVSVFLNGEKLYWQPYGYTGFTIALGEKLRAGEENVLSVLADNSGEPNTRWYSGSGIYRPVWLYVGSPAHIAVDGIQVTTKSCDPAVIHVAARVSPEDRKGEMEVALAIRKNWELIAEARGMDADIRIPNAALWSAETPELYICEAVLYQDGTEVDRQETSFGICEITWSTKGLFINGTETKLRGACIHHDNGILGASEFSQSARRRVKILKDAGFNAIRCAHNPCSKALLAACDELGLYVMDEFVDMWYEHKNRYDYASWFETWYERDLTAMIRKDISHPSVIFYSIGNEVTETAEPSGIEYTKKMTELAHRLDDSRSVTCGINMSLNVMHFAGLGVYQPAPGEAVRPPEPKNPKALAILAKMQEARMAGAGAEGQADTGSAGEAALGMTEEMGQKVDGKLVGSEYFNQMMMKMKEQQQVVVKQEIAKILSEDAFAALDIAGYNYAVTRYELDAADYPQRVSVGTETLPQKICQNWQAVMACPYSVGDFIWTGWDYLGEAGIGAFCYDSVGTKDKDYPFLLAGSGIIDILGNPRPEVWLNKAVYGLTKAPYIGVEPVTHAKENHIISAWRYSDAVHSWSWEGCEGDPAEIVVYCAAPSVELFLNGISLGVKETEECQAHFSTTYVPGTLEAVALDENGKELGRDVLTTAASGTKIVIDAETPALAADGQDVCYLNLMLTGEDGVIKSSEDRELTVTVEGCGVLEGFGNAAPCTEEIYTDDVHTTYYGVAQAVIRAKAGADAGQITVRVSAEGLAEASITIPVKN